MRATTSRPSVTPRSRKIRARRRSRPAKSEELAKKADDELGRLDDAHDEDDENGDQPGADGHLLQSVPAQLLARRRLGVGRTVPGEPPTGTLRKSWWVPLAMAGFDLSLQVA